MNIVNRFIVFRLGKRYGYHIVCYPTHKAHQEIVVNSNTLGFVDVDPQNIPNIEHIHTTFSSIGKFNQKQFYVCVGGPCAERLAIFAFLKNKYKLRDMAGGRVWKMNFVVTHNV